MITRRIAPLLSQRLQQFPAVGLLGPRQAGKTTLARSLSSQISSPPADYLDLENPADLAKLSDPLEYLHLKADRLVIIDEIQRSPGLFQVLRSVIDDRIQAGRPSGHFLLLGSASIDLLKQSSESLAGRIAYLEMTPLDVLETNPESQAHLWVRGGFPRSLLARSDDASAAWRDSFITTYLERDIPQLGPRIAAETLRRFWTMLAHRQGSLLNAAELARSLAVDGKTVAAYLDLMVDLLLVRRLAPFHANVGKRLVKSPKTYVRDSGLAHSLLRLETLDDVLGHPIAGMSWEGFAIENLIQSAPQRSRATFYRTSAGAEIDLVLELPGNKLWVIEIKRGSAPNVTKGFFLALEHLQPDRAFIVYSGTDRYPKSKNVEAIGLAALCQELADLG
jgi:predicted AAA+ superfamily ATPase